MGNVFCKPQKLTSAVSAPIRENEAPVLSPVQPEETPMPPIEELNQMFDLILVRYEYLIFIQSLIVMQEDLNLQSDKKEIMRKFPPERKWILCQAHLKEKVPIKKSASSTSYNY